jgi:hypothetical protein
MKPQNQVTVRSSETGDVFRISRQVAVLHDTLTILDDDLGTLVPADSAAPVEGWDVKPLMGGKEARPSALKVKSVDKPADPIAAPVADDK